MWTIKKGNYGQIKKKKGDKSTNQWDNHDLTIKKRNVAKPASLKILIKLTAPL